MPVAETTVPGPAGIVYQATMDAPSQVLGEAAEDPAVHPAERLV